MRPSDAERFMVNEGDFVNVVVGHGPRQLTFNSVLVRINEAYKLEMHIDTDEANAAGLNAHDTAVLKSTLSNARITTISKPT
jgi:propanediol utilization protein